MSIAHDYNFKQITDALNRIERFIGTVEDTKKHTIVWEIQRLDSLIKNIQTGGNSLKYEFTSTNKDIEFNINHSLNSDDLNITVYIYNEEFDYWENCICKIIIVDKDNIKIQLTEESKIKVIIRH